MTNRFRYAESDDLRGCAHLLHVLGERCSKMKGGHCTYYYEYLLLQSQPHNSLLIKFMTKILDFVFRVVVCNKDTSNRYLCIKDITLIGVNVIFLGFSIIDFVIFVQKW